MYDSTAYAIMVFSPVIYLQLQLSIRYTILYSILRKQHSNTFLKKHRGNYIQWMFFRNFKPEIGPLWHHLNALVVLLEVISIFLAVIYLVLWLVGHVLLMKWIPWAWAVLDMACYLFFILKRAHDRLRAKE